mmetsp:Transcript_17738/g.16970  ORF Transcript_17738/g.16970 Transcript_17738/m.16970 type:complete len:116 (+) Transcript_17738:302-649(+)
MKKGENSGLPIPLHCTWYVVSQDNNNFVLIEHVCGAYYQPSIDDIGYRICVHAIPASDAEEYQGMPMFAEVGPLEADKKIFDKVEETTQVFPIQFEKVDVPSLLLLPDIKFPAKC